MKKRIKIVGIVCLLFLTVLLLLPFAFKGKLTNLVRKQGHEIIRGDFDFSSLDVSFFAHLPKATIRLNDFWLHGEGIFQKDTLAKIDELSITVDLFSLFGKQYKVENIYLKDASFKAVVAKDGQTNWNIMKEVSEEVQPITDSSATTDFNVMLKRAVIKNMSVMYDDRQNSSLSSYDDIDMNVHAKLQNDRYELIDSSIKMKGIKAYIDGWVSILEGKDMDYDVHLKTDKAMLHLSNNLSDMNVSATELHVTPELITLAPTVITTAHSNLTINCVLRNIGNYLVGSGVLNGKMNLSSKLLDLNDFMSGEMVTKESTEETPKKVSTNRTSSSIIEIPKNIDFIVDAKIQQLNIKAMKLTQLKGQLLAKNEALTMKDLAFDMMKGQVKMNGVYTTRNVVEPSINAQLSMKHISFSKAYIESEMIKKLVPIFSHAKGTFSSSMSLDMLFNNQMNPLMNSVQGKGHISTDNLLISDVSVLDKMAKALKNPELSTLKTKDLDISFAIKDGVVTTSPFNFSVGNYKMTLGGQTGLDKTIDYRATVEFPAGQKMLGLSEVNLSIGGTFDKPLVKVDTKKLIKNLFKSGFSSLTSKDSTKKKKLLEQGKSLLKGLFK